MRDFIGVQNIPASGRIIRKFSRGLMASAEREPIMGVWGQSPQRGPGAEPLVGGSRGQSPPEAESLLQFSSAQLTWKFGHF